MWLFSRHQSLLFKQKRYFGAFIYQSQLAMSCTITTSTLFKILKQYEHLKLLSRSFHAAFPQKHTPDITGLSNQEAAVQRCSVKKVFLAISQNLMEETCAKASFSQACNFIKKKRPWHKCFPVNFVKFLRTPFLTEHLRWLLLVISTSWNLLVSHLHKSNQQSESRGFAWNCSIKN